MADLSDVEKALVSVISAALYPNGEDQMSAIAVPRTLAQLAAQGATSIQISSADGLARGMQVTLWDAIKEVVVVAPGYGTDPDADPLLVPLDDALVAAHAAGIQVTWQDLVRVFRGWPSAADLERDMRLGVIDVSIYSARYGSDTNTTRFPVEWQTSIPPVVTVTASIQGNVVTLGGTVTVGNIVMVLGARGMPTFAYAAVAGDTLVSMAAALAAAAIAAGYAGSSSAGASFTVGGSPGILTVRLGGRGTSWRPLRQQQKQFQVTVWCSDPLQRDRAGSIVDLALARLNFLTLSDGQAARITYWGSGTLTDNTEKELIYRRDMIYTIEYSTAETSEDTTVLTHTISQTNSTLPRGTPAALDAPPAKSNI